MMGSQPLRLVPLPGSERPRLVPGAGVRPEAERAAPVTGPIEVTVVLRRRAALPASALSGPGLSSEQVAAAYGADPGDVDTASRRFTGLGLQVLDVDPASRRLRLGGDAARMEQVFGTSLRRVDVGSASSAPGGAARIGAPEPAAGPDVTRAGGDSTVAEGFRLRSGELSIPADLDGIVTAVLGLDDRPQSRSLYRVAPARAVSVSYSPVELARIYDFPTDVDGTGQTVAIVELGGGFDTADLDTYFSGLGVGPPKVTSVGVDGAGNVPGDDPSGADGEVLLDIEVVGAMAPGADLVVYFAPNTDAGFLDAVSQAAHATPSPAAISISWGQSEDAWTEQARRAMDEAFADAAALGVTVICAAGDDGSTDRVSDGQAHVDFPAASPHALSCGGTRLDADPTTGAVTTETVWNNGSGQGATGGGYSITFARPDYQATIGAQPAVVAGGSVRPPVANRAIVADPEPAASDLPGPQFSVPQASGPRPSRPHASVSAGSGRGVPDVAGVADPQTGYQVLVDGRRQVIGGTSAVAPLWAALIARLAQARGARFGLIHPLLYGDGQALRDITEGNNGAYSAGRGWDPCTGLGVPVGTELAAALSASR